MIASYMNEITALAAQRNINLGNLELVPRELLLPRRRLP